MKDVSLSNRSEPRKDHPLFLPAMLTAYAASLAIVVHFHEMFRDEMQAWLIARDSKSIPDLFWNLRYEGHPALWHLFLYLPSHISWNPVSMQVINWVFAVAEAWVILSAKRLHWLFRALLLFSFFVFYGYGAIARNYMLGLLLLTAASLLLLNKSGQRAWAIVLLGLAINTHFFAIPIALLIFVLFFCFPTGDSWRRPMEPLRTRAFWAATAVLLASLATAYAVMRPPADRYTPWYSTANVSAAGYFLISEGRAWQMFAPVPEMYIPEAIRQAMVPRHAPSIPAATLSLFLLLLLALCLRTARGRFFFLCAALLEFLAFTFTVRIPPVRHYGFVFLSLLIAMLVDAYSDADSPVGNWIPRRLATGVMVAMLAVQVMASASASILDIIYPFSEAKETSEWLKQNGYANNPMALQIDTTGTSVLGYLEREKAYYPACRCEASFVLFRSEWDHFRTANAEELDELGRTSKLPVLLVSDSELDPSEAQSMNLTLLRAFRNHPVYKLETCYVYLRPLPEKR